MQLQLAPLKNQIVFKRENMKLSSLQLDVNEVKRNHFNECAITSDDSFEMIMQEVCLRRNNDHFLTEKRVTQYLKNLGIKMKTDPRSGENRFHAGQRLKQYEITKFYEQLSLKEDKISQNCDQINQMKQKNHLSLKFMMFQVKNKNKSLGEMEFE